MIIVLSIALVACALYFLASRKPDAPRVSPASVRIATSRGTIDVRPKTGPPSPDPQLESIPLFPGAQPLESKRLDDQAKILYEGGGEARHLARRFGSTEPLGTVTAFFGQFSGWQKDPHFKQGARYQQDLSGCLRTITLTSGPPGTVIEQSVLYIDQAVPSTTSRG